VKSYVTRTEFSFTDDINSADIIWTASHFRKFGEIKRLNSQFINQFPFESVITCKDLLARICQKGTTVSIIYKTRQFHHLVSVRAY
jgi:hypothetical protein